MIMRYHKGKVLDAYGEVIPERARTTVLRYQRQALNEQTDAERAFYWVCFGLWKLCGVRYVKQVPFYITRGISFRADFVFRKYKLIVEIDGGSHRGREERDAWRDQVILEKYGYRTIRFTNEQVINEPRLTRISIVRELLASAGGWKRGLRAYMAAQEQLTTPW